MFAGTQPDAGNECMILVLSRAEVPMQQLLIKSQVTEAIPSAEL
jgi:hypothetical protein